MNANGSRARFRRCSAFVSILVLGFTTTYPACRWSGVSAGKGAGGGWFDPQGDGILACPARALQALRGVRRRRCRRGILGGRDDAVCEILGSLAGSRHAEPRGQQVPSFVLRHVDDIGPDPGSVSTDCGRHRRYQRQGRHPRRRLSQAPAPQTRWGAQTQAHERQGRTPPSIVW